MSPRRSSPRSASTSTSTSTSIAVSSSVRSPVRISVALAVAVSLSLSLSLALALAAGPALAQEDRQDVLGSQRHSYASPQNFAIEVRFSPFYPQVDSDPALHGCQPFNTVFGGSPSVMVGAEFDWQALRIPHLGTLGPGVGISTVSFSANAPNTGGSSSGCLTSSSTSGESTSLTIYPVYAVAVLRADVLWRELGVPFVPYAKLGPAAGFWQASNTLGVSDNKGSKGQGYTLGTQLAVGMMFNLNVFDEYAARNFDEGMGVNGTYIYAEWTDSNLDGLWGIQPNALRVGGTSWTFGLAWEF